MNSKTVWYIVKRILLAILTTWIVITLTFFAMHAIPGGPFLSEKAVTESVLEALNAKYGLDKPLFIQYLNYLKGVLQFDFGPSIKLRGQNVTDVILQRFPVSAAIGLISSGLAILFGVVFGSLAAVYHNKWIDKAIMVLSTAAVAMPSFVIATVLLLTFCGANGILPIGGNTWQGLILPIAALMLYPASYVTRLTRSSTLDVLSQDYIRTARAKGVSAVKVLFKHSLRNALTPVITYAGPMIAYVVTGSLVVERIFGVPGIGALFVNCILNRDYTMIMGTTIFLTVLVIMMILLSDILYKVINPRVSFE